MPKAFENNSIIGKSQFDVCGAAIRTQFTRGGLQHSIFHPAKYKILRAIHLLIFYLQLDLCGLRPEFDSKLQCQSFMQFLKYKCISFRPNPVQTKQAT
jgi:hypothetical protein